MKKLLVLISMALLLVACSSDSKTSSTASMKITGKVSGFTKSKSVDEPDTIVAMYDHGQEYEEFTINSDGSFDIDTGILEEDDIVLFVVNSQTKKIYGNLKLPTGNATDTLDIIDASKLEDDLDVGTVNIQTTLCSTTVEGSGSFSESNVAVLEKIAQNDDVVKLYQNIYVNSDIEGYVGIKFNIGTPDSVEGQYNDISAFSKASNLNGVYPIFYPQYSVDRVELYPPSAIKYSNPDNLTDYSCTNDADENTPIIKTTPGFNAGVGVTTIEVAYVDELPAGSWILNNDDTDVEMGDFVFVAAEPFDASGNFKAFVPTAMINTSVTGDFESLNIKWYRYSGTGYDEVINEEFFSTLAYDKRISIVLNTSSSSFNLTDSGQSTDEMDVLVSGTDFQTDDIDRVIISYKIGMAKYQFFLE